MPPNKKKKKPAGNPARGFATTSIASKPKPEKQPHAEEENPPTKDSQVEAEPPVVPASKSEPVPTKPDPTPEELEAQLERDELQLLVEKIAPKVRRESQRQVSKCQTDRRLLRSQAENMTVHDWLPNDIVDTIISLAQTESNDSNRRQGQQSLLKVLSEEDALTKLWMLDLILRDLHFLPEHTEAVLRWLCANAASVDKSASVWGLQEALEWLALDHCENVTFSYEEHKLQQSHADSSSNTPRPGTPTLDSAALAEAEHGRSIPTGSDRSEPTVDPKRQPDSVDQQSSDIAVSDIDSDLEPDQLIPTYLKVKGKLFEIDPGAADPPVRKQAKKTKVRDAKPSNQTQSPAVRKLLSQIQQLESDPLFHAQEAEAQWPTRRNEIARIKAAQRTDINPSPSMPDKKSGNIDQDSKVSKIIQKSQPIEQKVELNTEDSVSDGEDGGLLGDMFSSLPDDVAPGGNSDQQATSENVRIRDFGKQTGITPRRVLEEAVRSRDSDARITYKIVSPTIYSCRHLLTINWSRTQTTEFDTDIDGVVSTLSPKRSSFEASTIAALSVEQSEGFISTVALFSICAPLSKEEKVFLRLTSNWRDVYRSFLEHRKTRLDAADRDTIKYIRSIIQDQLENEESDGVVLTSRFKARQQAVTSSGSSSGHNTPRQAFEGLRELWLQKSSAPSYQRMLIGRSSLPVYGFRDSILATIDQHQITIICGETGCGKSTQIPSFLLEHELSQGKPCKIFCTEPRRISAISLAQRVSEELGEGPKDLGTFRSLVGYAIRLESKTSPSTRLVFATVGVVLRMLESTQDLNEVTHLVIDEVHERSIDTDFLLIILRSLILKRPELKIILMSATVDAQRFSQYLNGAPILNVPGRTFPVQTKFLEDAIELTHYTSSAEQPIEGKTSDDDDDEEIASKEKSGIPNKLPGYSAATRNALSNYDEYAIDYELIARLMEVVAYDPQLSQYSNAILCFLPGIAEIRQLNDILVAHPSFDKQWLIYPLHSTISSEEQQAAFLIPPPGVRKIVLATNIAETGVTIPDITCVIDTGKHKEMRFDERRQLSRLTQSFISRANAKQRKGRAGRVQEGLCFHLFTQYRHDNLMMDQQTPEMLRLSLQDLVMRTKICKLGDIEKTLSEALDPPTGRNIRRAIDALIEVDALTPGEELTSLGRQIAILPLDAHLGKLVLLGSIFSCVDVTITIAAILSSKSPFLTPFHAKQRADAARFAFKKGDSDLLTTYNAYKSWKTVCTTPGRSEQHFCHKNFLSAANLANIEDLKAQLLSSLAEAGFVHLSPDERRALSRYRSTTSSRHRTFVTVPPSHDAHSDNDILVNSVIAAAFYPKILLRDGKGWRNISNNQTVSLSPTSVNKISNINPASARFLSYYHIMQSTSKFYNAHSTSIAYPLPMVLMVGADMDFKLHAGVVGFPNNTLRFAVKDWRAAVALKALRRRVKEILSAAWRNPGREMNGRDREWVGLFERVFVERFEKEEKIREKGGLKGK
ncbi:ATP-dependent RNA helicase A [Periconia macrospinosa]|uniref:RNA helicase n=1 Tax=Periconia macrospinosa TaxID=97972 RepID=A0A2V1DUB4_9PLEO|nr:ATP-dependent RNA helicase A [Periconia macrospinosa]